MSRRARPEPPADKLNVVVMNGNDIVATLFTGTYDACYAYMRSMANLSCIELQYADTGRLASWVLYK